MTKFTNTGEGPRGINLKSGGTAWADPGQTIELDEKDLADQPLHEDFGGGDSEAEAEPGPLDGSVDDLTAHVATLDDPDAIQALIDAETAGKSRKGALAALEARRDELLAA